MSTDDNTTPRATTSSPTNSNGRDSKFGPNGSKPTCQANTKYGHLATHCYNRYDESYMGFSPDKNSNSNKPTRLGSSAFVATLDIVEHDSASIFSPSSPSLKTSLNTPSQPSDPPKASSKIPSPKTPFLQQNHVQEFHSSPAGSHMSTAASLELPQAYPKLNPQASNPITKVASPYGAPLALKHPMVTRAK
uniref:Uncharacterized protein n=1 Tax=Cannabis sativa TaxID=3483 RepID=A0A803P3E9_CANSA